MPKADLRVHLDRKADAFFDGGDGPVAVCRARYPRRFTHVPVAVTCKACRASGTWQRLRLREQREGREGSL